MTKKRGTSVAGPAIALVLAVMLAGAASAQVKLGVVDNLTGAAASYGISHMQGIRLAAEDMSNPNVNKVVCGVDGRALYFSKHPIPYDREGIGVVRYKHPGFYAYRKAALDAFHRLPPSPLELVEKLEQLRFLENGIDIVVVETDAPTIGVDTEADLRAVEALLTGRRPTSR